MAATAGTVEAIDRAAPQGQESPATQTDHGATSSAGASPAWQVILWLFVALAGSLAFGTYLEANELTDPFLYYDTAFVQQLQTQTVMTIPASGPFASLSFVP